MRTNSINQRGDLAVSMNVNTVALTDYRLKSPTLAKVIVAFTGRHSPASIREALVAKFDGQAMPIENSFRIVGPNAAVGFVRANTEVRALDPKEVQAKYRVVSSNVLMDASDKSLWSKKEGAAGVYLTRQGQEDLTALMASTRHNRTDVPALRHLATPLAAKSELVAFVTPGGDMDYGFAVAQDNAKVKLVSFYGRSTQIVDYDNVVSIIPVQLDREIKAKVTAGLSGAEKANAVSYWKQLYFYDPDYMNEVIRQVEEDAVA